MGKAVMCVCGCKHVHVISTGFNTYFVRCAFCGLRTQGEYLTEDSAIRDWNKSRR